MVGNEDRVVGTEKFSGGQEDDWAGRIKGADIPTLDKLEDILDDIGGTRKNMANWPSSRLTGLREQIQQRYAELTGVLPWGKKKE